MKHVWTNQVKMKICVILCCFLSSVTPVDQDNVGDSLQLVRDNVDYLESVIRDQNDEIELLRRNLTETLKYDKMQEMVERNGRLEEALESLKGILHESSQRIIQTEADKDTCVKNNDEKDKMIKNLNEEMLRSRMYKAFFINVISQLRSMDNSGFNFETVLSDK